MGYFPDEPVVERVKYENTLSLSGCHQDWTEKSSSLLWWAYAAASRQHFVERAKKKQYASTCGHKWVRSTHLWLHLLAINVQTEKQSVNKQKVRITQAMHQYQNSLKVRQHDNTMQISVMPLPIVWEAAVVDLFFYSSKPCIWTRATYFEQKLQ